MQNCAIVLPVYNDYESVIALIAQLDQALHAAQYQATVFIVDDASTLQPKIELAAYTAITRIEIIHLATNLGHQGAIAIGLAHVNDLALNMPVVIMDSDGEDRPEDVLRLLAMSQQNAAQVILAVRAKRSERIWFKTFYFFYKQLFSLLIGKNISFGNFSCIPAAVVPRVAVLTDISYHYAATLVKSRIPMTLVPTIRGTRIAGESKMDFIGLIQHGLRAFSVFSDRIAARLLVAICISDFIIGVFSAFVFAVHFFTNIALPSWVINLAILMIMFILHSVTIGLFALLYALLRNDHQQKAPFTYQYKQFIRNVVRLI